MPTSAGFATCWCIRGLQQPKSAEVIERALADQIVRADEPAYTKLGTAWFTAGELDKAVFPLENASRIASTGDAYVRLAVVHVAREDWPAVIAALHAGMGRGSLTDAAQANMLMGVALYRQRQFDEAKTWFEQATDSPQHRPMAEEYCAPSKKRRAVASEAPEVATAKLIDAPGPRRRLGRASGSPLAAPFYTNHIGEHHHAIPILVVTIHS